MRTRSASMLLFAALLLVAAPAGAAKTIAAPADVAAAPADAKETASGLRYKILEAVTNPDALVPGPTDTVEVHYTGWTTDGKMFDSSRVRGTPLTVKLDRVVKGWTEGLQLMRTGERARFWIPGKLAYGDEPRPGGIPYGTLVFDIELIGVSPVGGSGAPHDVAAPPESAKRTASGLAWRLLKPGTGGVHPTATDKVEVHYSGWTTDGKMFDSSVERGQPAKFPLNAVIAGWTEGVQLMRVGDKARFWIPGKLAYGDTPKGGRPHGMLVFDIELLKIDRTPEVRVPEDVAAPPLTATVTASGLAYRILKPGTGTRRPSATSKVTVHYSGWTTDGKMFDSSVLRGQPASFALNAVIKGWTEGLALMRAGQVVRFWIPANLAYGDNPRPGAPKGMLVFDVELISFE